MQPKKQALLIIYTQTAILLILCVLFAVFGPKNAAVSALLGGLTALLPAFVMLLKMFSPKCETPAQMVRALYKGEVQKLLLTAILFVVFIQYFDVQGLSFFISFVVTLLAYWVVLLITISRKLG